MNIWVRLNDQIKLLQTVAMKSRNFDVKGYTFFFFKYKLNTLIDTVMHMVFVCCMHELAS